MREIPYSPTEKSVLIASRVLTTTLLAALLGAVINYFYELFFDTAFANAGSALTRGIWTTIWAIPFILVAILVLGIPASYLLRQLRLENWVSYALCGAALGILFLYVLFPSMTLFGMGAGAIYGGLCASIWFGLKPKA
ncbi:hypothetical protein ACOYW6_00020 [Parablastomonas sp. CN1-191]|uniref:hypothetical protein n=1 Tax=Parablastomonas sp. CN1-191 TaxID=3400908 RepID=UPI003BF788BD